MDFFSERFEEKLSHAASVWVLMEMVIFWENVFILLWSSFVKKPEFHDRVGSGAAAQVLGSGMHAQLSGYARVNRVWGHLDLVQPGHGFGAESCRGCCSVLGPLTMTAGRATGSSPGTAGNVYVGVDNLNAVRHVGRINADLDAARPYELMNGGHLLTLVRETVS